MFRRNLLIACCAAVSACPVFSFPEATPDGMGKRMLDGYFSRKVAEVERSGSLAPFETAQQWLDGQAESRRQLAEMLGLDPMPERTPLEATIVGTVDAGDVIVERLHYQSMPGLYVTANFYRPKVAAEKPLPAILYVCGHAKVKVGDASYGNKTAYHHHGLWFARHGYVCLTIDTLQLGEIEGEHHGTHHLGKWWWVSRGYTPAGVEAWNGIRGIDYLQSRAEVDGARIGVTGRSGGGAYSWWVAALDERVTAAAPTAGITDMRNHVIDGVVEGHCDCMFHVNTFRWDFDRVAALVAPRALLICNTDKDRIFPLDGVVRTYQSTRRLYQLLGAEAKFGLHIAEGGHRDTQPLNTGAFHWFERFLKGADVMDTTDAPAVKEIEQAALRVFDQGLPEDQRNTRIDHEFVAAAKAEPPADAAAWAEQGEPWMEALRSRVFGAWPQDVAPAHAEKVSSMERDGVQMTAYDFESEKPFRLRLWVAHRAGLRPSELKLVVLNVLDEPGWDQFCNTFHSRFGKLIEVFPAIQADEESFGQERKMYEANPWAMAYVCPRGIGTTAWEGSERAQTHRLRRFNLLGETLESTQVWDIRRSLQALRDVDGLAETRLWLQAHRVQAANAVYASLFGNGVERLDLHDMPISHAQGGPTYLNVLKVLDLPQATALAAERTRVVLYTADAAPWSYASGVADLMGDAKAFEIRQPPSDSAGK